jgi:hypothetical protein
MVSMITGYELVEENENKESSDEKQT